MARTTGSPNLTEYGVPISAFKARVEKHLHHPITNKQFALLYGGWATRYCLSTDHGVHPRTPIYWLKKGYVPREHANNLSNYLITGWKVIES